MTAPSSIDPARFLHAVSVCPVSRIPPASRAAGITGSRNASSQYRAYERIASRDSARSSPPDASPPITRRRLPSSTWTPVPRRRQACGVPKVCWGCELQRCSRRSRRA
jgi:hypothetical protein